MKKFIVGLIVGLLLASAGIGMASPGVIRIFLDDQEIVPDVPPVIIDGRVMVPARFIAEPLGATVEWDGENRAVVITGKPHAPTSEPVITQPPVEQKSPCLICNGKGQLTCLCRGTIPYCVICRNTGKVRCVLCFGTGFFPPW